MTKSTKLIIGIIVVIIVIAGIWYGLSRKPKEEVITIGAIWPLSGGNAVYGIEIQNAIELAKEEINSKGGINGKNLEIIYEDDQADPTLGTKAMQKLVTVDKVPVVLGSWASGVVVASAPIAEQNQVVVLASAISPAITEAGDYIFRVQPSAAFYTAKSAELLREMDISSAAIIYVNNEFGVALKDAFVSDFEAKDGKVITIEAYSQGDSDFRAQLTKIKEKNPEIIFIPGYQDTIDVIKQIKELGIEAKILAGPPFESKSTIEKLEEMAEGVLYPYHFVAGRDNPKAQQYEEAYLKKYGIHTGGFAPLMYDGTYIIANALKKCGEDTECIKQALYDTEYNGVTGKITFDENGDPIIPIVMKTVKNGQFVPYEE
jgi:branched-chain amino acid transport system substrate-binding protein